MFTRLRAATAAIILAAVTAMPTLAHTGAGIGSHIYGPCNTGNNGTNDQIYLDPLTHTPDTYDYVASTVTITQLYACNPQNGTTNYGWTIVNAANMNIQGLGLLQFGYGVCADIICPNTWPSITTEEFWFTKDSNGVIYAAEWVDFDSNGVHDRPVYGRSYTFSIEIQNANTVNAKFVYVVKDNYTGLSDSKTIGWAYADNGWYPWWSYERLNSASGIGTAESEIGANMRLIKYSTAGTGVTTMTGTKTIYGDSLSYVTSWTDTDATYTRFHVVTLNHT